jgi:hypothetical protein
VSRDTYTVFYVFYNSVGAPHGDFSISSAEVRVDTATLVVNRTIQFEGKRPEKDQRTQQPMQEDGAWRVVLRDETLKLFAQFAEQSTATSTATAW